MFWDLIKSTKPLAIVAFLLVWNCLMAVVFALNGGMGRITSSRSLIVVAIACGLLAVSAALTAYHPSWQRLILQGDAKLSKVRPPLLFLSLLGTALAVISILSIYGVVPGHT